MTESPKLEPAKYFFSKSLKLVYANISWPKYLMVKKTQDIEILKHIPREVSYIAKTVTELLVISKSVSTNRTLQIVSSSALG